MMRILVQPALGELGAIIVAPDSVDGGWSTPANERPSTRCSRTSRKSTRSTSKKVVVTGFSMGGAGVWYWADKYPERFSAAIRSPDADARTGGWRVPVFAVHSRADQRGSRSVRPSSASRS
jgi:triacylglycerol esterase/lipase EstA (alpha/beta hydrolase family)